MPVFKVKWCYSSHGNTKTTQNCIFRAQNCVYITPFIIFSITKGFFIHCHSPPPPPPYCAFIILSVFIPLDKLEIRSSFFYFQLFPKMNHHQVYLVVAIYREIANFYIFAKLFISTHILACTGRGAIFTAWILIVVPNIGTDDLTILLYSNRLFALFYFYFIAVC